MRKLAGAEASMECLDELAQAHGDAYNRCRYGKVLRSCTSHSLIPLAPVPTPIICGWTIANVVQRTKIMRIRLHPSATEALVLDRDLLTRWDICDPPHRLQQLALGQTAHLEGSDLLAVSPDGEFFATLVTTGWDPGDQEDPSIDWIQVRRWMDLQIVTQLPIHENGTASTQCTFSPDGHWLVAADSSIQLWNHDLTQVMDQVELAEFTCAVDFNAQGTALAFVGTGQGGGTIGIYHIRHTQLELWHTSLDRRGIAWPDNMDLAAARASLAFTPAGDLLGVYTTSEWGPGNPSGWQGELTLYDVESGRRCWYRPFDHQLLGDDADIRPFESEIHFTPDGKYVLCGTQAGEIIALETTTGQVHQRIRSSVHEAISSFALTLQGTTVWTPIQGVPTPLQLAVER